MEWIKEPNSIKSDDDPGVGTQACTLVFLGGLILTCGWSGALCDSPMC